MSREDTPVDAPEEKDEKEEKEEPVPDFNKVLEDLVKRGLRIYHTNEPNLESLITMCLGFGMNAKAVVRLFDILVFQNGTLIEIEGFDSQDRVVTNTLFMAGHWFKPKRSVYLRIRDGKQVENLPV